MYIIELINKFKNRNNPPIDDYEEPQVQEEEIEDALTCKHNFMPIDSTKKVLACTKCGYVIKNANTKVSEIDKNPFKDI